MITIEPVGYVKSERTEIRDDHWRGVSEIVLADGIPDDALVGVDQFSHVEILFHFHRADKVKVVTGLRHPRNNRDWPEVGIFARRGKNRPNHLGLTVAKVVRVDGRSLFVEGLDAIDGTPVVDIKPLMKGFLPQEAIREPRWSEEIMANYWSE